jgi:serine/threonine protein kinase
MPEPNGPNDDAPTFDGGSEADTSEVPAQARADHRSEAIVPGRPERREDAGFDGLPERIGKYKVVGPIGRGGMGLVVKATHETDLGPRLVAIKLIKRGVDTEEVLERFRLERRVLSALNHPNIARFFEAGETEDGRPYFVMEYVEGQPITAYCDANNLPVKRRLELFGKVCDAVHHAHTNLVVHRDIKPENIVVTPAGEPKLLDFGIAKLLNPQMAGAIAVTGPGVRLMTPEYASPEQARGEPIGTLSDVYSLGVLLYELLSGRRPYRLVSRLEHEIVRVICETDPDRPSTVVTKVDEIRGYDGRMHTLDPQSIASRRGGKPESLRRQLSGDLDDIVMLAMSKAPAQRYPSVQDMASDVGHFLRGEPVRARRSGQRVIYVARKFVKRHRTLVASTAAAMVALVAMGSVAFWQYTRSVDADLAAAAARVETAEALNRELVRGSFGSVLWSNFSNRIIDVNLPASSREELWRSIVESFESLREKHGQDNPIVLEEYAKAMKELGDVLGGRRTGNVGDSQGALDAYTKSSDIFAALAANDPQNWELVYRSGISMIYKGDLLRELNRSTLAVEAYARAHELLTGLPEEGEWGDRRERALSVMLLTQAQMAGRQCMTDEAIEACRESIRIREARAARDPESELARRDVAIGHVNLGEILLVAGDTTGAEESFRRALTVRRGLLERGERDSRRRRDVGVSGLALASALVAQERHDAAESLLKEAEDVLTALVSESPEDASYHDLLTRVWITRGENELAAGRSPEALAAANRADSVLAGLEALAPGNASNEALRSEVVLLLGRASLASATPDEARPAIEDAVRRAESLLAADPERAVYQRRLALAASTMGDLEARAAEQSPSRAAEARAWYARAQGVYDAMELAGRLCGVPEEERARVREQLRLFGAG